MTTADALARKARPGGAPGTTGKIDFDRINQAALAALPALCERWLPDGRRRGREWIALNPRRLDRNRGSFKVNLLTGRWADFAVRERGASGGDPVSLAAYLAGIGQLEAAEKLADMLGIPAGVDHGR
jgi:hypothetical protein